MSTRYKHGGYIGNIESAEHYIWRSMIRRCTNPSDKSYEYYGGRGITVCTEWLDYTAFILDMGKRPTKYHTLDRINNILGYSKSNCRWASRSEQQKNKRTTKLYSNGSFVGTPAECAAYIGISKSLASFRMRVWGTYEKGVVWQILQKNV